MDHWSQFTTYLEQRLTHELKSGVSVRTGEENGFQAFQVSGFDGESDPPSLVALVEKSHAEYLRRLVRELDSSGENYPEPLRRFERNLINVGEAVKKLAGSLEGASARTTLQISGEASVEVNPT